MEGKCLPRPPNSLAAKEGLLIHALTLPPSDSPEKGPPTLYPQTNSLRFLLLQITQPSLSFLPIGTTQPPGALCP